jgi:hypothetical protein
MLRCVSAHIEWYHILILELQLSYEALSDDLVLPSATALCNICQRESAQTVDGIKKQLLSQKTVSLPSAGWTSMNKLAITLVIAYYMDRNLDFVKFNLLSMRLITNSFPLSKASEE